VSGPFAEYRTVMTTEPLRQGDVLESVQGDASAWTRHLFVITADCDLAHQKHHGRVTCVPLMTSHEYLLEMHVPRIRDRIAMKHVASLGELASSAGGPHVSPGRLREWVLDEEPDVVARSLNITGASVEAALTAIAALRLLGEQVPSLDAAAAQLVAAQFQGPGGQKRESIVSSMRSQLRAPFTQPPGDALFLSAIAPGHADGYFAYLRHLEQVWEPEISTGSARSAGASYRRIARLDDRYSHALVQRFAAVFLSIGLPDEYESMRDFHADLLGEGIQ
jgi:hypothetical protein